MKAIYPMIHVFLVFVIVFQLILVPVALDIGYAQSSGSSIIIAHQPVRMGYRGRSLNLMTNVNDDVGIKRVSVVINYGSESKTGNMPVLGSGARVPVQVSVVKDTRVYSKASKGRVKGNVYRGEVLMVTRVKDDYYRVMSDSGLYGYVKADNLQLVKTGKSYGVSIPAQLTNFPFITYQIIVTDARGNIAKSKVNKVRLLTRQEVADLRARRSSRTGKASGGSSGKSYTKYYVLAGLIALSGGAYYLVTKEDDDSETTVVDIQVGWE